MTATTLWIYGTRLVKELIGFLRLALRPSTGLFSADVNNRIEKTG